MELIDIALYLILIIVALVMILLISGQEGIDKILDAFSANQSAIHPVQLELSGTPTAEVWYENVKKSQSYFKELDYNYKATISNLNIRYPADIDGSIKVFTIVKLKGFEIRNFLFCDSIDEQGGCQGQQTNNENIITLTQNQNTFSLPKILIDGVWSEQEPNLVYKKDKVVEEGETVTVSFWKVDDCFTANKENRIELLLGVCKESFLGSFNIRSRARALKTNVVGSLLFMSPISADRGDKISVELLLRNLGQNTWGAQDNVAVLLFCKQIHCQQIQSMGPGENRKLVGECEVPLSKIDGIIAGTSANAIIPGSISYALYTNCQCSGKYEYTNNPCGADSQLIFIETKRFV